MIKLQKFIISTLFTVWPQDFTHFYAILFKIIRAWSSSRGSEGAQLLLLALDTLSRLVCPW